MVRCQTLRKVKLTLQSSALIAASDVYGMAIRRPKSTTEMVEHYGLGPILACKGLEEVHIDWMYFPRLPLHLDYARRFRSLHNLAVWLRDAFGEQGREVKVCIPRITEQRITEHARLFRICLSGGLNVNLPSEGLRQLDDSARASAFVV